MPFNPENPTKLPKTPELVFATIAPETWQALANTPRTGWVNRGVQNPESVQEHTTALREIASRLENLSEEEKYELVDILEVHDWPEAIVGDQVILTNDPEEKKRLKAAKFEEERTALLSICDKLGEAGRRIFALWMRFETSDDEGASLARQIDKYQAIEKALEYELSQGILLFQEFYTYSEKHITHPMLRQKLDALMAKWTDTQH